MQHTYQIKRSKHLGLLLWKRCYIDLNPDQDIDISACISAQVKQKDEETREVMNVGYCCFASDIDTIPPPSLFLHHGRNGKNGPASSPCFILSSNQLAFQ